MLIHSVDHKTIVYANGSSVKQTFRAGSVIQVEKNGTKLNM